MFRRERCTCTIALLYWVHAGTKYQPDINELLSKVIIIKSFKVKFWKMCLIPSPHDQIQVFTVITAKADSEKCSIFSVIHVLFCSMTVCLSCENVPLYCHCACLAVIYHITTVFLRGSHNCVFSQQFWAESPDLTVQGEMKCIALNLQCIYCFQLVGNVNAGRLWGFIPILTSKHNWYCSYSLLPAFCALNRVMQCDDSCWWAFAFFSFFGALFDQSQFAPCYCFIVLFCVCVCVVGQIKFI